MMTENEKRGIKTIFVKFKKVVEMIKADDVNENTNVEATGYIKKLFSYLNNIKTVLGNYNQDMSYISCLLAKEYLIEKHKIKDIDVSLKAQGASGYDIEAVSETGEIIIAEIKTTQPYHAPSDFGATQKDGIINDLDKLINGKADIKYFFVTEKDAYDILQRKYMNGHPEIHLVCLT